MIIFHHKIFSTFTRFNWVSWFAAVWTGIMVVHKVTARPAAFRFWICFCFCRCSLVTCLVTLVGWCQKFSTIRTILHPGLSDRGLLKCGGKRQCIATLSTRWTRMAPTRLVTLRTSAGCLPAAWRGWNRSRQYRSSRRSSISILNFVLESFFFSWFGSSGNSCSSRLLLPSQVTGPSSLTRALVAPVTCLTVLRLGWLDPASRVSRQCHSHDTSLKM